MKNDAGLILTEVRRLHGVKFVYWVDQARAHHSRPMMQSAVRDEHVIEVLHPVVHAHGGVRVHGLAHVLIRKHVTCRKKKEKMA